MGALAQVVVRDDETLGASRPEAWAMNYVAASTLMTSFGEAPALATGRWDATIDLGNVPRLSEAQQRVGFDGTKPEDLNRSPVFGRVRAVVGLPAGFVAEVAYTPPITIRGTRARDLFAASLARRIYERGTLTLSLRAFGQHGRAGGDITCPARLAGAGPQANPFGCRAPSSDQIALDYYGVDLTSAWRFDSWSAHGALGVARTELATQVDALTFEVRDRSRLVATASRPFATIGARRELDANWSLAVELLYVPLRVRRAPSSASENDPYAGLRMQLRYRFD